MAKIWGDWDFVVRYMLLLKTGGKRVHRCPAGKSWICIDTNGDLYPCPGIVSELSLQIGSLAQGITDESRALYVDELHVDRKASCNTCWARYFYGGGCYHAAYLAHHRIDQPDLYDCELTRHYIKLAI